MKPETVEIPTPVLSSVETLDELQDWLTAQNPKIIAELRAARREDRAGKFKPWKPRHLPCLAGSKISVHTWPKRRWRRVYSSSASKNWALRKSGQRVGVTTSSA